MLIIFDPVLKKLGDKHKNLLVQIVLIEIIGFLPAPKHFNICLWHLAEVLLCFYIYEILANQDSFIAFNSFWEPLLLGLSL